MAVFTPAERRQMVDRVAHLLYADTRVEGVVLVGSMAGRPDRWSDIDLAVVLADGLDGSRVARDWVRRLYEELPVAHHFETEFGPTLVRGFMLESSLEIDLAFDPVSSFAAWEPARLLFDRAGRVQDAMAAEGDWSPAPPDWAGESGFAWHDVLHASTAIRRRRPWQALWYLQRVRGRALALAQQRRGLYADFFDYVDDLPQDELHPWSETLVTSLEPSALSRALERATRLYFAELEHGAPGLRARIERPLLDYLAASDDD
ncbi:MAG TPA: nucleotidyltransferase domain-containing protein [Actinomycetota bacterium]|nr:nucleotidyltransferase domain-containing protein [Actinomycetota bacterium]